MTKARPSRLHRKKTRQLMVLALPATLLVFIFSYIPMGGVFLAFKNVRYDDVFGSPWNGFKNFEFFFKNDAWAVTRNTLAYNAAFIVIGTVFALILALMLNEIRSRRLTKTYQTIFFFPYFFSWVIVTYMVYSFLAPKGILPVAFGKQLKSLFGINLSSFYTTAKWWPGFIIFLNTWKTVGYNSVLYYAGLMGISNEYYEAAQIDGANKLQMIRYITLPLLTPLVSIMTLLAIGGIFRADFGLFYFVPRDVQMLRDVTAVIDTHVYRMLKFSGDLGMSTAVGLYQSVLGFVVVMVSNAIVKRIEPENSAF